MQSLTDDESKFQTGQNIPNVDMQKSKIFLIEAAAVNRPSRGRRREARTRRGDRRAALVRFGPQQCLTRILH